MQLSDVELSEEEWPDFNDFLKPELRPSHSLVQDRETHQPIETSLEEEETFPAMSAIRPHSGASELCGGSLGRYANVL